MRWMPPVMAICRERGYAPSRVLMLLAFAFTVPWTTVGFWNAAIGLGLMLARLVGMVLGLANGTGLVMTAFAGTGAIFLGMAALSTVIKRDLSAMGKFLFIGAIMVLVAGIANFFLQSSALMLTLSVLVTGIFSAFILYDLKQVRDGYETNYISATLNVYLDIYNVFQGLLSLFGIAGSND